MSRAWRCCFRRGFEAPAPFFSIPISCLLQLLPQLQVNHWLPWCPPTMKIVAQKGQKNYLKQLNNSPRICRCLNYTSPLKITTGATRSRHVSSGGLESTEYSRGRGRYHRSPSASPVCHARSSTPTHHRPSSGQSEYS